MTKPAKQVCPYCHGVITAPRRVSLEVSFEHHEESCPMGIRIKKTPAPVVVEEPPRRRVIQRTPLE